MTGGRTDEDPQDGAAAAPTATPQIVGPRFRALTALLAVIGGTTVAVVVVLVLVVVVFVRLLHVDHTGAERAADDLASAARALPGVRSAVAEPGLGDLGVPPIDVYADVRLTRGCDHASVVSTASACAPSSRASRSSCSTRPSGAVREASPSRRSNR